MKKEMKNKILARSVLGVLVFLFAIQFASALNDTQLGPIGQWFGSWENGDLSANIAKYLFWALVSMVVFSIGSKLPGIDAIFKGGMMVVGAIFSIIVGFLSMAYITPEEVYALMNSYSALGFVLGGALPFIILFFFTITLAMSSEGKGAAERYGSKVLAFGLWILFTVFIAVKAIFPQDPASATGVYYTLSWVLVALSIACTIAMGWIFKKVQNDMVTEKINTAKQTTRKATKKTKMDAAAVDDLAERTTKDEF